MAGLCNRNGVVSYKFVNMKKLILALALLCAFQSNAQSTPSAKRSDCEVRRFEGEIGVGINFGADKLNFNSNRIGATFFAEGRYNLQRLPIDVGLQIAGSIFHRDADNAGNLEFQTWNVLAVTDYNFRRCNKVSFFAGFGLGYTALDTSGPIRFDNSNPNWAGFSTGDKKGSFCFMPRVGVELFHRLRFTFDYKLQEKTNRHFDLTVGFVFGGGRK